MAGRRRQAARWSPYRACIRQLCTAGAPMTLKQGLTAMLVSLAPLSDLPSSLQSAFNLGITARHISTRSADLLCMCNMRQEAYGSRAEEADLASAIPQHKDDGAGADEGIEAEEESRGPRRAQAPVDHLVLRPAVAARRCLLLGKRSHLQHVPHYSSGVPY